MTDDAPPASRTDLSPDRELTARAVTINRPAEELYAFYRDFSNLPTFMENVVRIDVLRRPPLALGGEGAGRQDGRMGRHRHP